MTIADWSALADVLTYGPLVAGAVSVHFVLRDALRSKRATMRYANVYNSNGEAEYLAVPVENGNMDRLLRTAFYEGGLAKPDYDVMISEEAAKDAASKRVRHGRR